MSCYSVVIPCYNSSQTIQKVVESTVEEFGRLGLDEFEFVLVNDCSPDGGQTRETIFRLAEQYPFVKAVDLGKNVGQHNALMAGLHYAEGDFIISMDDDMQTRPSEIIKLIRKLNEGYDIVYGYYEKKKESLFRRMGSIAHHLTVQYLMQKPKGLKTSSFWIIRKYVRDYAIEYTYPRVAMQGIFLRITNNITCTPLNHYEREVGTSGYTLKKMLRQYDSDLGFSVRLLNIAIKIGLFFTLLGFVGALVILIRKLVYPAAAVSWIALVFILCFFSGIVLIAIGILGNYVGRMYRGHTSEPQFVVREAINIPEYRLRCTKEAQAPVLTSEESK